MKFFLLIVLCSIIHSFHSQKQLDWEFFHPLEKKWISAGTFGSVQEVLISKGELPNPFEGLNEKKFDWIEDYIWEYRSKFFIDSTTFKSKFLELEFPLVDTYAKIYLNDSLLIETSNSFLPYNVQIKDFVKLGENKLTVTFIPPILKNAQNKSEKGVFYPAPNDVGKIQVAPLVRKPQYQFGWDWTMRMNTIGFLKPVKLHAYSFARISSLKNECIELFDSLAIMEMNLHFTRDFNGKINLKSSWLGDQKNVEIKKGHVQINFEIENPILWWPLGQGEPFLYRDTLILSTVTGNKSDTIPFHFGIKKSQLIQEKDSIGTSFYFKINNRPIFCKGANFIPMDIFPSKVTHERIEDLVKQMIASNFNTVRVWGGGYYPDDYFYDLCDKYGIMVWQDLMFACAMYPSDNIFLDNVKNELEYQISRISAHPSLILFNGNNEVDVAWKFWGFQDKYAISETNQAIIQKDYVRLFKEMIPEFISTSTMIPYIHTSPLGHWINQEDFPHGTQHYWGVWHGKDPIEDFGRKSGRFNAEYGFQSFPEYSTLLSFSKPTDWNLNSQVMSSHQKSYVGNGMIKKHADILFGKTTSFMDFVYFSQLTQAKAVGIAISAHRLLAPTCMGTIFWQLNDCWPAPTWSSIDYYGNWKALQYRVRDDFRNVTVLEKTTKIGEEQYFMVSDSPKKFTSTVNVTIKFLNGTLVAKNKIHLDIQNGLNYQLFKDCNLPQWKNKNYLIEFEWMDENQHIQSRQFVHLGNKKNHQKTTRNSFNVTIEKIDTFNKTALLVVKTSSVLIDFWMSSKKMGVKYSQNFKTILPGKKEITIEFDEIPSIGDFEFKWR
jgi:beta-mannosidase